MSAKILILEEGRKNLVVVMHCDFTKIEMNKADFSIIHTYIMKNAMQSSLMPPPPPLLALKCICNADSSQARPGYYPALIIRSRD